MPEIPNPYDVGEEWYDINEWLGMSTEEQYRHMQGSGVMPYDMEDLYSNLDFEHNPRGLSQYSYDDLIQQANLYYGGDDTFSAQEYIQDYIDDYSLSQLNQFYETSLPFDDSGLFMGYYGQYMPTEYDTRALYETDLTTDIQKQLLSDKYRTEHIDPYLDAVGISNLSMTSSSAMKNNPYEDLTRAYESIDLDRENLLRNISALTYSAEYGGMEASQEAGNLATIDIFPSQADEGAWTAEFEFWYLNQPDWMQELITSGGSMSMGQCVQTQAGSYLDEGFGGESFAQAASDCDYLLQQFGN